MKEFYESNKSIVWFTIGVLFAVVIMNIVAIAYDYTCMDVLRDMGPGPVQFSPGSPL